MHINTHSALLDIFAVQMPKARRAGGLNVYAGGLTFHAGVQFPHRQAVRVRAVWNVRQVTMGTSHCGCDAVMGVYYEREKAVRFASAVHI